MEREGDVAGEIGNANGIRIRLSVIGMWEGKGRKSRNIMAPRGRVADKRSSLDFE